MKKINSLSKQTVIAVVFIIAAVVLAKSGIIGTIVSDDITYSSQNAEDENNSINEDIQVADESNESDDAGDDIISESTSVDRRYTFRNDRLFEEHFEKHGGEFPYNTREEYLEGANIMLANPDKLHKLEKEDGDDVYYLEETNEFIIVSKDGYLRTYFKPSKGKQYFDKQ